MASERRYGFADGKRCSGGDQSIATGGGQVGFDAGGNRRQTVLAIRQQAVRKQGRRRPTLRTAAPEDVDAQPVAAQGGVAGPPTVQMPGADEAAALTVIGPEVDNAVRIRKVALEAGRVGD